MADNHENERNTEQDMDLGTIELEIDKEIDSLFIPAGAIPLEMPPTEEVVPEKAAAASEPSASGSPDQASLEFEMEREIDSLFVPADATPPLTLQNTEIAGDGARTLDEPPASGAPEQASLEFEIEREIDSLFVPADATPPLTLQNTEIGSDALKTLDEPSAAGAPEQASLEFEIEREIDSLFVPADATPPLTLQNTEIAGDGAKTFDEPSASGAPDLTSAELQIDREIDALFVPANPMPPQALQTEEIAGDGAKTFDEPSASGAPDLTSAELQIDREIDALFVPAAPMPFDTPVESKTAAASAPRLESESHDGFDIDNFESQIDMEIDSMFVPAGGQQRSTPEPAPALEMADSDLPGLAAPIHPSELQIPTPVSAPQPLLNLELEEITFSGDDLPPQSPSRAQLPKLVESFNAAYLSLDWEFSSENIRKLQSALSDLEPFADRPPGSAPIFKILRAVLSRLAVKPQSANAAFIEMIRDCQGLLAHMLLMGNEAGPNEKARVKAIINRFRTLKEKAIATRNARLGEKITPPVESPQPEIQVMEEVILDEKMPDRWSLRELKAWMESVSLSIQEILTGMDGEIKRIRQIEQALVKARALTQVLGKLTDIRSGLEGRISVLKEKRDEWNEKASWVEALERVTAESDRMLEKSVEIMGDPVPPLSTAPPEEKPTTPQETLCLFRFAGKLFALPSFSVIKIQPVNQKKAASVLKRGKTDLEEFRLLFRSIKTGVLGEWAKMPGKALKSFKFSPITPHPYEASDIPAGQHTAIFVSNGFEHGVVFADPDKIEYESIGDAASIDHSPQAAMGTFKTESGEWAEVLDPDRILHPEVLHPDSTDLAR